MTAHGPAIIKALIFDIDGTLLDSVDLHAEAWLLTFRHFGITAEFLDVRSRIGEGADHLLPAFLPGNTPDDRKKEIEDYRSQLFKKDYLPRVRPFPKVRELFQRIVLDGRKAVLASSCTEDEIERYKAIAGIVDLVEIQVTADDAKSSKPAPDIFLKALAQLESISGHECVVVGDTRFDGEAARKAGIPFIGLLCGGSSERELAEASAIATYKDPADLLLQYPVSIDLGSRSEQPSSRDFDRRFC